MIHSLSVQRMDSLCLCSSFPSPSHLPPLLVLSQQLIGIYSTTRNELSQQEPHSSITVEIKHGRRSTRVSSQSSRISTTLSLVLTLHSLRSRQPISLKEPISTSPMQEQRTLSLVVLQGSTQISSLFQDRLQVIRRISPPSQETLLQRTVTSQLLTPISRPPIPT